MRDWSDRISHKGHCCSWHISYALSMFISYYGKICSVNYIAPSYCVQTKFIAFSYKGLHFEVMEKWGLSGINGISDLRLVFDMWVDICWQDYTSVCVWYNYLTDSHNNESCDHHSYGHPTTKCFNKTRNK